MVLCRQGAPLLLALQPVINSVLLYLCCAFFFFDCFQMWGKRRNTGRRACEAHALLSSGTLMQKAFCLFCMTNCGTIALSSEKWIAFSGEEIAMRVFSSLDRASAFEARRTGFPAPFHSSLSAEHHCPSLMQKTKCHAWRQPCKPTCQISLFFLPVETQRKSLSFCYCEAFCLCCFPPTGPAETKSSLFFFVCRPFSSYGYGNIYTELVAITTSHMHLHVFVEDDKMILTLASGPSIIQMFSYYYTGRHYALLSVF